MANQIQPLRDERRDELQKNFQKLAGEGKRVLAFAYKNFENNQKNYTMDEAESDLIFV